MASNSPRGHLLRLAPEFYRGRAVVHWTMTMDDRRIGWLDREFHARCRESLLHTMVRYHMLSPIYCLMPDHAHFVWMGIAENADSALDPSSFGGKRTCVWRRFAGKESPMTMCCERASALTERSVKSVSMFWKIRFERAWRKPGWNMRFLEPCYRAILMLIRDERIFGRCFGKPTTPR